LNADQTLKGGTMPVKIDSSGRRSVRAEAEVPGTPEEVWRAIATGPGISSWFVPTEVETDKDGVPVKVVSHFGPGTSMDAHADVTAWEPPHRYAADSRDDMGPNDPTIATEWVVEARSGGTCVVRVVHSWFASTDDWDNQFEGHEQGWVAFFRILRLYLLHFRGQPCSAFQLMSFTPEPKAKAWEILTSSLGLQGAATGQQLTTRAGAPALAGVVERVGQTEYPEELLMRLSKPAPGLAHFYAMPLGGQVCVPVRIFLYGSQAAAAGAHEEPIWQTWMNRHFPTPSVGEGSRAG
jgi:uncharacterized protein YndB with AHSA1/START domain